MSETSSNGTQESQEWLFDWNPYRGDPPQDTQDFHVALIEGWKYEDDEPAKSYELQSYHTEAVESWLAEPIPNRDGRQPTAGFKVVVMPCGETSQLPHLTQGQRLAFNEALGLPHFQKHYNSLDTGACGMFSQSDNSYVFILRRTTDWASIGSAFRYDPKTNVTYGVYYIELQNISFDKFEGLPEQFMTCSHPLLLPLLAVELTFETKVSHLANNAQDLDRIEDRTGYGLSASGSESESPDYRALVKGLGKSQSQLYLALATIAASRLSTQFIQRKIYQLNIEVPEECRKNLAPLTKMLGERIEWLLSNMEYSFIMDAMKERMEAQQTVLFNLIAQADSLINVSLAQDSREMAVSSKQDSSAMKIIALLTTFFLPGTFIASFFAMPLFDWSMPQIHQVTNPHFWVYWAVTGPLTLITMVGVIAWALWNSRHIRVLQSRARESVVAEARRDEEEDIDEKESLEKNTARTSISEGELSKKHSLLTMFNRRRRRHYGVATGEP